MHQPTHRITPRVLPAPILIAAILLPALILSGCGGGGAEAPTNTAQSEEGPNAKALASTGGWVGSAPKYEVINGITVPPEPAPSVNNATLAGVDINNNGVRDDVERKIARAATRPELFTANIREAKLLQKAISTSPSQSEALAITFDVLCLEDEFDGSVTGRVLLDMTVNTEARRKAYKSFTRVAGPFSSADVPECK